MFINNNLNGFGRVFKYIEDEDEGRLAIGQFKDGNLFGFGHRVVNKDPQGIICEQGLWQEITTPGQWMDPKNEPLTME